MDLYMNDCFIFWPKYFDFNNFSVCLNNLHLTIKSTFKKGKVIVQNSEYCQVINFLDVSVIIHPDPTFETETNYKDTNSHNYLHYDRYLPDHSKDNASYNLAKRIIVFVSNEEKVEYRLN